MSLGARDMIPFKSSFKLYFGRNFARRPVLYGCPLAVWENMTCVRGLLDGGRVRTVSTGGSLIPSTMSASSREGTIFAPAYRTHSEDDIRAKTALNHLNQLLLRPNPPLASFYKDLDILPSEVVDVGGGKRAAAFPNAGGVFFANADDDISSWSGERGHGGRFESVIAKGRGVYA